MSKDTTERLRALADARHTSVSQLITDWTWQTSISPRNSILDGTEIAARVLQNITAIL